MRLRLLYERLISGVLWRGVLRRREPSGRFIAMLYSCLSVYVVCDLLLRKIYDFYFTRQNQKVKKKIKNQDVEILFLNLIFYVYR